MASPTSKAVEHSSQDVSVSPNASYEKLYKKSSSAIYSVSAPSRCIRRISYGRKVVASHNPLRSTLISPDASLPVFSGLGSHQSALSPSSLLSAEYWAKSSSLNLAAEEIAPAVTLSSLQCNLEMSKDLGCDLLVCDHPYFLQKKERARKRIEAALARRSSEYTTFQILKVFTGTFNVNGADPSQDLRPWLSSRSVNGCADLYLLAFQEVQTLSGMNCVATDVTKGKAWLDAVENHLQCLDSYCVLGTRQLVGILLVVAVKKRHRDKVQDLVMTDAGTGLMGCGGNKGGVACRFMLFDRVITCVSAHLAAHHECFERRNQDFHDIIRKATFEKPPQQGSLSDLSVNLQDGTQRTEETLSILDADIVFWLGDLNYRIDLPIERVFDLISKKAWVELFRHDQLRKARINGDAFAEFKEAVIRFAPTYKYENALNKYHVSEDESLSRAPAWCDRILWRDRLCLSSGSCEGTDIWRSDQLKFLEYARHEIMLSDHRPVSATFSITLKDVNLRKKSEILKQIRSEVDLQEKHKRAKVAVSAAAICLARVQFGEVKTFGRPVILENSDSEDHVVHLSMSKLPAWLHITLTPDSCFTLRAGQKAFIRVQGFVDGRMGRAPASKAGECILTATLAIAVDEHFEFNIAVSGRLMTKTSLESSFADLVKIPPRSEFDFRMVPELLYLTSIPRERRRLVKLFFTCRSRSAPTLIGGYRSFKEAHLEEVGIFERKGLLRDTEFPYSACSKAVATAVATWLIRFLNSLKELVVRHQCDEATLKLGFRDSSEDGILQIFQHASVAHLIAFKYIIGLRRHLPGIKALDGKKANKMSFSNERDSNLEVQ